MEKNKIKNNDKSIDDFLLASNVILTFENECIYDFLKEKMLLDECDEYVENKMHEVLNSDNDENILKIALEQFHTTAIDLSSSLNNSKDEKDDIRSA